MSTNADCRFYERESGKWYYEMQKWPYGENQDYDKHGPFSTWTEAHNHMHRNYANPGSYTISAIPGCEHDMTRTLTSTSWECLRCGHIGG